MLSNNEILDLWRSGGPFRNIAAEEIIGRFDQCAPLFFSLLPDEGADILVRKAKGQFPFLMRGFGKPEIYNPATPLPLFDTFRHQEAIFRDALANHIATLPPSDRDGYKRLIAHFFPELHNHADLSGADLKRQLMVFVTGICNLNCPYCFSSDLKRREIPLPDLQRIFNWARRQGVRKITPCGGEPLIYPHFDDFIAMTADAGMTTYFASNLTVPLSRFPHLSPDVMEGTYAHLTHTTMADKRFFSTFSNNVEHCLSRGIHVTGRLNITSPEPEILFPLVETLKSMGIDSINFALTIPSTLASNSFMKIANVDSFIPAMRSLLHFSETLGIAAGIAKPLPACRFPESDIMRLLSSSVGGARCEIDSDDFMHNISISPDLEFSPCLGLEKITVPFADNISWQDLHNKFAPLIYNLLATPLYPDCQGCYLWLRRLCQGACLTYKQ